MSYWIIPQKKTKEPACSRTITGIGENKANSSMKAERGGCLREAEAARVRAGTD
jgi:hypothetical protein